MRGIKMQTVFAEKTEDRSLDDNRHIGELFFIRMYWEKGRIPSGNILYWKDATFGIERDSGSKVTLKYSFTRHFASSIPVTCAPSVIILALLLSCAL